MFKQNNKSEMTALESAGPMDPMWVVSFGELKMCNYPTIITIVK